MLLSAVAWYCHRRHTRARIALRRSLQNVKRLKAQVKHAEADMAQVKQHRIELEADVAKGAQTTVHWDKQKEKFVREGPRMMYNAEWADRAIESYKKKNACQDECGGDR